MGWGVTFLRLAAALAEAKWRCWANLQNTHFSGLTRKKSFFKRSVLKYVSIKKPILTQSGQKRRVCVNQPDGLWTHLGKVKKEQAEDAEGRKEGRKEGKDKAPCALSSKGLWSNR